MSTQGDGYVRSTNGICLLKSSQILKVKYLMTIEQNIARSFELFVFLSRCFSKRYGAAPVIRREVSEVLANMDRKQGNLAR